MRQLSEVTKRKMKTVRTATDIHDSDLINQPEEVKARGRRKPYEAGEPIRKRLSAKTKGDSKC